MVQGLLENRKRMTRRTKGLELFNKAPDSWKYDGYDKPSKTHFMELISSDGKVTQKYFEVVCPYNVGDVFWVRETSHKIVDSETLKFISYGFKADNDYKGAKWTPSIFMPKEACRIFLKLKSIRVERLQDISREDARSEGIELDLVSGTKFKDYVTNSTTYSEKTSFFSLWESINGKKSLDWNPFVWVYEFEQIEKPNDFIV